jgi:hypothetical protein
LGRFSAEDNGGWRFSVFQQSGISYTHHGLTTEFPKFFGILVDVSTACGDFFNEVNDGSNRTAASA